MTDFGVYGNGFSFFLALQAREKAEVRREKILDTGSPVLKPNPCLQHAGAGKQLPGESRADEEQD